MANSNGKFAIGVAVGALIGAVAAYFSDRNKRERFVDDMSCTADKVKDSVVEGYYDAKDKYMKYRNKLVKDTEDLIDEIEDELTEK
ncbi:YtxH domain-containing protein [Porphyromonas pogonae]|uniref:YtxH domain-containing protein n=1 Tax=Porphyromonas pogonae TaxID=867595 RepID=UPI002E7A6B96|nr:YtxH domain-containing protein [Porphyromonas pogonae]